MKVVWLPVPIYSIALGAQCISKWFKVIWSRIYHCYGTGDYFLISVNSVLMSLCEVFCCNCLVFSSSFVFLKSYFETSPASSFLWVSANLEISQLLVVSFILIGSGKARWLARVTLSDDNCQRERSSFVLYLLMLNRYRQKKWNLLFFWS